MDFSKGEQQRDFGFVVGSSIGALSIDREVKGSQAALYLAPTTMTLAVFSQASVNITSIVPSQSTVSGVLDLGAPVPAGVSLTVQITSTNGDGSIILSPSSGVVVSSSDSQLVKFSISTTSKTGKFSIGYSFSGASSALFVAPPVTELQVKR